MFLDEARLSARMSHTNVVQTYEVGYMGERLFMALEYLEGQSYSAVLNRIQKLGQLPLVLRLYAAKPPDDGFFDSAATFIGAIRDESDTWASGAWVKWGP